MKYKFAKDTPLKESAKIIATSLDSSFINFCNDNNLSSSEIIHELRKNCKRIRAFYELVKNNLDNPYRMENKFYRNLSRKLSEQRDYEVQINLFEKLKEEISETEDIQNLQFLIDELSLKKNEIDENNLIKEFYDEVNLHLLKRDKLKFKTDSFLEILNEYTNTYKNCKPNFKQALKNPNFEEIHEFRKIVKKFSLQTGFLTKLNKKYFRLLTKQTHLLSENLGDYHDICDIQNLLYNKDNSKWSSNSNIHHLLETRKYKILKKIKKEGDKVFKFSISEFKKIVKKKINLDKKDALQY